MTVGTLKKRVGKLEPELVEAWKKTWEDALLPEEFRSYDHRVLTFLDQIQHKSQEEQLELDQRFFADHENYPALKAWDDSSFNEWREAFIAWFHSLGFDWNKPDLTLWPHQAPKPPEIPQEAIDDLRRGASKWRDELAEVYAFWLVEVAMAVGVGRAIAAYEARVDTAGQDDSRTN